MAQVLYDLLNSQVFWILLGIWLVICIVWVSRWKSLGARIGTLMTKPNIFREDKNPENVPFYPRLLFEDMANAIRNYLKKPFNDLLKHFTILIKKQHSLIFDGQHAFRTFGYLLLLLFLIIFVLADAITIFNTLYVMGIISGEVPFIMGKFEIAVFGGSLGALILGLAMVFDLKNTPSFFTDWSDKNKSVRNLGTAISFLISFLSLVSLIVWGLSRMIQVGKLDSSPLLDGLISWVLYVIVPFNSALAAAICFQEAMKGLYTIIIGIQWFINGIVWIFNWLADFVGVVFPFLFDILYRILYIVIDILQWLITTPILVIFLPFKWIKSIIDGTKEEESKETSKV